MTLASVIVRTKNEAAWIRRCLKALSLQDFPDVELVIVDNDSTDGTLEVAESFGCKIVKIPDREFSFGRSLNRGIESSEGEFIAMLSGHCIPVNDEWLQCLHAAFRDESVAGVYGRQEPMADSDPFNKRDLWTTFGIERRVQRKEFFFHNANSMIRRDVWKAIPFDEEIHGVEDRDWAKKVLAHGRTLVYEPSASVYHHHGIHHGRDEKRAERVVRVIQSIQDKKVSL